MKSFTQYIAEAAPAPKAKETVRSTDVKSLIGTGRFNSMIAVAMVPGWATDNNYSVLIDGFAQGAVGSGSGTNAIRQIDNINNTISQNYDSSGSLVLAVIAIKLANNSDMKANLVWSEIR